MAGFPVGHVRVVAVAVDEDDAFVVLDAGPAEYRYLYGGTATRESGRWQGGIDGNGGAAGWTLTDQGRELGVVAIWDEAPPGADAVRVRWRGEAREVAVRDGVYLSAWWREPCPEGDDLPAVTAVLVDGRWVAVPGA